MKNKGLIILGGLVVALGLYAYFGEYKREIKEEVKKETDNQIVKFKKDQIQKIELKKGEAAPVVLERTIDGWNLTSPIQDQADNETIDSFLEQIVGEKAVDQIDIKGSSSDAEYGFKPSLGEITLINNTNEKQRIEVSTKKNFENLVFLRRDSEKKVLTSSQTWTTFLTKPTDQFRNLRLFRGSLSQVNRIRLENSKGSAEFRYNDGAWFAPQKTEWKIDQNAVREILTQANTAKGTETIPEKKLGSVGSHLLTLEFGSEKANWKALLHQDKNSKDVIAAIAPERMIIRFAPQTLEDLRSKKLIDFRDKTDPFHFQSDQIKKIVARAKVKTFTLVKNEGNWYLEKKDPKSIVNSTLAQDLIGKLSRLTVYHYIEGKQPKPNFDSEIQLFDDANQLVFQMSWSEFKDHEGFAQTNLFKEVFQIDDAQIHHLSLHEILTPKPSEANVEKPKEDTVEKN
jgi:hypothetical protein